MDADEEMRFSDLFLRERYVQKLKGCCEAQDAMELKNRKIANVKRLKILEYGQEARV